MNRNAVTFAAISAALCAVPLVVPGYRTSLATEMLIFATLAMSIDVLAGYAGRTSLGHGAIFGIAAYVVLYYVTVTGGNAWVGAALGLGVATAAAVVFGLLAIRTSGVYFLLITLALGMIVWGICLRWTSVTGGENGLRGAVRPSFIVGPASFYYFVLAATALMTFAMWRFVHSPFGLTLRGIRGSESRIASIGSGVRIPATTSSPCAFARNSP